MAKESEKKHVEKAKNQLIKELEALHKRVSELEKSNSERKWIDATLLKRKLVRSATIEDMPDGVMLVDTNGKVIYVNKAFEKLLGYMASELIGTPALNLHIYRRSSDRKRAKEALKEALEEGSSEHIDIGVVSKSGQEIAINVAASVIKDAQGIPKTLVAVMRDITGRKREEEALRKSEENFRVLIDNSMDISMIMNRDMTIRYVSPSVERTLGYRPEEIVGKNTLEFLYPEDVQNITANFDNFAKNHGRPVPLEVRFLHRNGAWHVIEGITNNLLDDPTVKGFVVNARDITERKRTEQERVEHAAALARAEEVQLSLQRIIAAQESVRRDIAQQLHGSVQNRLIILIHRLTELERKSPVGELAQEIGDLRQKLSELLDNQVRPISHRLYPSILRRGLVAALQSLGDQFEVYLDIEMELDEELRHRERRTPQLISEGVRLAAYRIAEEAVTNVVKHTKASKITIGLRLLPKEWLCLTLHDNGQGFEPKSISNGRGLLMMQDYAEMNGGKCIIRSAPGEGTEITALLPLSEPGAEHPEKASLLA